MLNSEPTPMPAAHELRRDQGSVVTIVRAGTVDYATAWQWQRDLAERRRNGEIDDVVLLLEHPAVFTAGRRADPANLVFDEEERARRGIEVIEVDRGGDFTYHGPGQLVGYPILTLKGIRGVVEYVRALEAVNIVAAAKFGIAGQRLADFTGVWVDAPGEQLQKLTAIGVRVGTGGVTQHGFAMNVTTHLDDFLGIVPCGITDKGVCSLASLGVPEITVDRASDAIVDAIREILRCEVREASPSDLGLTVSSLP
ncbi:MAG: lipoyl(octanoyl) transferase [Glaciecola sp.]|jgi:lipoyl(octanoyl) transferase